MRGPPRCGGIVAEGRDLVAERGSGPDDHDHGGIVRIRTFLLMTSIIAATFGTAAPAAAYAEEDLGYTNCIWDPGPIDVWMDGTWPGTNHAPDTGARQSFRDQVGEAMAQWNHHLGQVGADNHFRWARNSASADVRIRLVDPNHHTVQGDYLAKGETHQNCYTNWRRDVQATRITRGTLSVERRSDWFTQGAAYRKTWEKCDDPSWKFGGSQQRFSFLERYAYTCSKTLDFQSLVIHELGHILGLAHPDEFGSSALAAANCYPYETWKDLDEATLCGGMHRHKTHGRTLHSWDIATVREHYERRRN